jgi:cephalosporin hydroxylase
MIRIDLERNVLHVDTADGTVTHPIDSPEAFAVISDAWLRCGWDNKYVYSFTWLGRPIIQLPEDLIRVQELISRVRPDLIIETGVAHGGSLVYYATILKALGRGRAIGIDVHLRPHNREALESHALAALITLVEGSSIDPAVLARVRGEIRPGETVLAILDSKHTKDHVLAELEAYAPLVTPGSYVIVQDGVMQKLAGRPRSAPDWTWNNPLGAIREFARRNPAFVVEEPPFLFNDGHVKERITYWPEGYLRRLR